MWLRRILQSGFGRTPAVASLRRRSHRTNLGIESLEDRATPATMNVLVPSYIYPTPGGGWDQMATAAKNGVSITAILNPDNGPGTVPDSTTFTGTLASKPDPNYQAAVTNLQTDGGQVIGYIHTSYDNGKVTLSIIKNEMLAYQNNYHVNGLFIDEMTTDAADVPYYQQIYQMAKSLNSKWIVVGNPGAVPQTAAYASTPVADVLVDYEGSSAGYASFTPAAWQASYPPTRFANIIYGAPSVAAIQADVSLVAHHNTGYVYVTNGDDSYGSLGTDWSQFLTAVQTTPIATTPAPAPATHFTLTPSTATPVAGTPFTVTLKAQDASGNTVTGYSGVVSLKTSDGQTLIGTPASVNVASGSATFTVTLDKADSLNLQATAGSLTGTAALRVSPGAAASFVVSAPSTVYSGVNFSITVTAKDAYGNTATGYSGDVTLTSSDPKASNLGVYCFASGTGVLTIPSAALKTAGRQTLLVESVYSTKLIEGSDALTVGLLAPR